MMRDIDLHRNIASWGEFKIYDLEEEGGVEKGGCE